MQLKQLNTREIYALKDRPSSSWASPVQVVETVLWQWKDTWGNWGGSDQRSQARVWSRAPKGSRAGHSDSWHANSWEIGVPVLRVCLDSWRYTTQDVSKKMLTRPFHLLKQAHAKLSVMDLVAEGHDGRVTGDMKISVEVEGDLADGTTELVRVSLELIRPQQIDRSWNDYRELEDEADRKRAEDIERRSKREEESNLAAYKISDRVDALLGTPVGGYDTHSERRDVHRSVIGGGFGPSGETYEISRETLMKLLALAEKASTE